LTKISRADGYKIAQDGYSPLQKGYVPGTSKPQGGHQPTTGQGAPSGPPPDQGTSVAPPKPTK
jgi:hypothetical protein